MQHSAHLVVTVVDSLDTWVRHPEAVRERAQALLRERAAAGGWRLDGVASDRVEVLADSLRVCFTASAPAVGPPREAPPAPS
ncbi:hypothetical protein [Kineococcus sp. SYSU DK006]|uniref:hypothetical protein n=1 Tax=Kineococcus sp. SYSU DK006 TaxID=3383127 RepID=UPI003D7EF9C8